MATVISETAWLQQQITALQSSGFKPLASGIITNTVAATNCNFINWSSACPNIAPGYFLNPVNTAAGTALILNAMGIGTIFQLPANHTYRFEFVFSILNIAALPATGLVEFQIFDNNSVIQNIVSYQYGNTLVPDQTTIKEDIVVGSSPLQIGIFLNGTVANTAGFAANSAFTIDQLV